MDLRRQELLTILGHALAGAADTIEAWARPRDATRGAT